MRFRNQGRSAGKPILGRYEQTGEGEFILDISANRVDDLFEHLDKIAPYPRKDLDRDFVEYMTDCAREIGGNPFFIRINISEAAGDESMSRARAGIHNYFVYLKDVEAGQMRNMFRTSLVLFGIGMVLLVLSIRAFQADISSAGLMWKVLAEGLTVAAWVSLWEALATFLIQWRPHRQEMKLYERLAGASVSFRDTGESEARAEVSRAELEQRGVPGAGGRDERPTRMQ